MVSEPVFPRGTLRIAALRRRYRDGSLSPSLLVEDLVERLERWSDAALWITRVVEGELRRRAAALEALAAADPGAAARLPLFGVPFAVKDNIDVAGLPTTAACPAFAYDAAATAPAVAALLAAGAILVGKTNLDQFATGLVGTRSPYGVPRNPFGAAFIPGGSSSGSAVAVAAGLVSFALGTDTAGSGRVPAAFNNIVGLKPSRGAVSTRGVVPACRSLDCVSVFALTVADAEAVAAVVAAFDAEDPFSRAVTPRAFPVRPDGRFRFGVPADGELEFFGDAEYARLYAEAVAAMEASGGTPVEIPFAPFREAGQLLYGGPWLAERLEATEALLAAAPEALLPVTRDIIAAGRSMSALDAFRAAYRLAALKRASEAVFAAVDFLFLPTAPTLYRRDEIARDPVQPNRDLSLYTSFTNLLDLAAIAVPAGFRGDGMPFGVTLLAPAFSDGALAVPAARFARERGLPLGATGMTAEDEPLPEAATARRFGLVVVGAHMSGMALNGELRQLGAILVGKTMTAPCYRLYALGGTPARPGLLRVGDGEGAAVEAELWSLDPAAFGTFVAAVPAPLSIGTLRLADGTTAKGFLCEAAATAGARDITGFGGWRNYAAAAPAAG